MRTSTKKPLLAALLCLPLAACDQIQHADSSAPAPTPVAMETPKKIALPSGEDAAIAEMEAERKAVPKESASSNAAPQETLRTTTPGWYVSIRELPIVGMDGSTGTIPAGTALKVLKFNQDNTVEVEYNGNGSPLPMDGVTASEAVADAAAGNNAEMRNRVKLAFDTLAAQSVPSNNQTMFSATPEQPHKVYRTAPGNWLMMVRSVPLLDEKGKPFTTYSKFEAVLADSVTANGATVSFGAKRYILPPNYFTTNEQGAMEAAGNDPDRQNYVKILFDSWTQSQAQQIAAQIAARNSAAYELARRTTEANRRYVPGQWQPQGTMLDQRPTSSEMYPGQRNAIIQEERAEEYAVAAKVNGEYVQKQTTWQQIQYYESQLQSYPVEPPGMGKYDQQKGQLEQIIGGLKQQYNQEP